MELEKEIVELRRTNEILKVRKRLETVKTCQLYAYIRKRRNQKTVKVMCKVLTVSVVIETKGSELSLNEAFPEELGMPHFCSDYFFFLKSKSKTIYIFRKLVVQWNNFIFEFPQFCFSIS